MKALVRKFLGDHFSSLHGSNFYSQEGEDIILENYFGQQNFGFYVDVGAHHPFRFSNTFKLYQRGWRGINIDPLPGSKKLFDHARPRDTNLEIGVAEEDSSLTYYEFNEPALNGFSSELSLDRQTKTSYKILRTSQIPVLRLDNILREHVPRKIANIDLLSVDAEGLDLNVLRSNDWQQFRPRVVIAELRQPTLDKITNDPIYSFLTMQGYSWFASTGRSCFFEAR